MLKIHLWLYINLAFIINAMAKSLNCLTTFGGVSCYRFEENFVVGVLVQ
jgi:hypothetical protein